MSERHAAVIVGSGPAAAGAVRALAAGGVTDVVVLERESVAGGVPRHCGHTGYGLAEHRRLLAGPDYARRNAREIAASADLRTGHTVTRITPDGSLSVLAPHGRYEMAGQVLLLAMGVRETPRAARLVSGARPFGVLTTGALQQMVYLEGLAPFRRLAVIGSELVAFSVLLTARHGGLEVAALIEERERITAYAPGRLVARHLFGVPVLTGTRLVRIEGGERVSGLVLQEAGRERRLACDAVVFTGRFRPEAALLAGGWIELDAGSRGPVVDQHWRTSAPGVFAAGNLVHPVETAACCFADGEAAGSAMAAALAGRLPPATPTGRLTVGGGLLYAYPQRISAGGAGRGLQHVARAGGEARGRLRLRLDGREVWSRQIHALPERRLRFPGRFLHAPFHHAELDLT